MLLSALIAEGTPIMVQAPTGITNAIGGNGMNSVKVFDLAKGRQQQPGWGSPWAWAADAANWHFVCLAYAEVQAAPDSWLTPGLAR